MDMLVYIFPDIMYVRINIHMCVLIQMGSQYIHNIHTVCNLLFSLNNMSWTWFRVKTCRSSLGFKKTHACLSPAGGFYHVQIYPNLYFLIALQWVCITRYGDIIRCCLEKNRKKIKRGRGKGDDFACPLSLSCGFGGPPTGEISLVLESCRGLTRSRRKDT